MDMLAEEKYKKLQWLRSSGSKQELGTSLTVPLALNVATPLDDIYSSKIERK